MRSANRTRVLDALRDNRAASRAELARLTGLSTATVSTIVKDLRQQGLIADAEPSGDTDEPRRGAGRPPTRLCLAPAAGLIVGVDLGENHSRVSVADLAYNILTEQAIDLDSGSTTDTRLDDTAHLIRTLLDRLAIAPETIRAVALGVPAPVHPKLPTITDSSIACGWANRSPGAELAQRLGIPVRVENEANLGALGEVTFGAARGVSDLIYLNVSTRISAGLILDGRVYHGAQGAAGEIGHIRYDNHGTVCRCGNRGCLESAIGAPEILRLIQPAHPDPLTIARIVELAETDPGTQRVLTDVGRAAGRVLADLANALNPAAIVIGGRLSAAGTPLLAGVRESLDRYAHPLAARTARVSIGTLGDRAPILGGLALAARN
ncbi:ROK family transcriptional regulator [Rugosimonospora acidiphila]|uniref:ROK family transcriptional regulator n=2 Tax=Rugosimonospora acidiphila TaxID=556531 RepID=A0ABP9RRZ8_9ACTN